MLFQPKHRPMFLFDAPADKGGTAPSPAGDKGTGNAPGGETDKKPNLQNSGKAPITFESEEAFQARVEELLKVRLDREQKKAEKAAEDARAAAEAEAAKKNGEWQKLAEQREGQLSDLQKRLSELEPVTTKAERYEGTLKKFLDAQRQGLPQHITALLDKLDPVDQLEWIAANQETLKQKPAGGPPATPPPANTSETARAEREKNKPQFAASVKSWFS